MWQDFKAFVMRGNVLDLAVGRVAELGGSSVAPAFDVPGVGRMAMVADTQGATFWVMAGEPPEA